MKSREKKRVVEIRRKITRGPVDKAQEVLKATKGCQEFNTSFIERFNAPMRERLASLTRTCRHAVHRLEVVDAGMFLIGCTYNFCFPPHEVSHGQHFGHACTPA